MKGIMGAAARERVDRQVYSVVKAAKLSASSSSRQNRSRLRRTYQLLSTSTKSWRERAASGRR